MLHNNSFFIEQNNIIIHFTYTPSSSVSTSQIHIISKR